MNLHKRYNLPGWLGGIPPQTPQTDMQRGCSRGCAFIVVGLLLTLLLTIPIILIL